MRFNLSRCGKRMGSVNRWQPTKSTEKYWKTGAKSHLNKRGKINLNMNAHYKSNSIMFLGSRKEFANCKLFLKTKKMKPWK